MKNRPRTNCSGHGRRARQFDAGSAQSGHAGADELLDLRLRNGAEPETEKRDKIPT